MFPTVLYYTDKMLTNNSGCQRPEAFTILGIRIAVASLGKAEIVQPFLLRRAAEVRATRRLGGQLAAQASVRCKTLQKEWKDVNNLRNLFGASKLLARLVISSRYPT